MRAVTYMIYAIAYEGLTIGGTAYLIGWRHWSPYWFILGVVFSSGIYSPSKWAALYDAPKDGKEAQP